VFIIAGLVNKLQMREYLSVHFCGHFFHVDPLSNRVKMGNANHVEYYTNALPNIHKILRDSYIKETGYFL